MTRVDRTSRREFVRTLAAGAAGVAALPLLDACRSVSSMSTTTAGAATLPPLGLEPIGWDRVPLIIARIRPPAFADRVFDVARYGAVGDGRADCTEAFRRAILACAEAGGGRVEVPAGQFLTGPIHLRSNVNLHVTRDATIAFHQDPRRYLPAVLTRWEGLEVMNYSPFIYALDQRNIGITGEGTLDGQSDTTHWWPWKGQAEHGWKTGEPQQKPARDRLIAMAEQNVPVGQRVFGDGGYLRPNFIQPLRCQNVLIEGVRIVRSPMWEIHPVLCRNVTVRNLVVETHGPNNDGCNPESCSDVLIEGCTFDTGDDCIAIKSGRNNDGRRLAVPSENIIIRNCQMKDGHGGVTIGSEISGGTRFVYAHDCRMDSPQLDRALRFKNNAARGGLLEHIYMRDVQIGQVADSVLSIDFTYEEGANGSYAPVARDVELRNVTSQKSRYALYLKGIDRGTISDIRVIDCRFDNVAQPSVTDGVTGLQLRNVTINGARVQGS